MTDLPFSTAAEGAVAPEKKIIVCDFFTAFVTFNEDEQTKHDLRTTLYDAIEAGHKVVLSAGIAIPDAFFAMADIRLKHQFPENNPVNKFMHSGQIVTENSKLPVLLEGAVPDIYIANSEALPVRGDLTKSSVPCKLFVNMEHAKAISYLRDKLELPSLADTRVGFGPAPEAPRRA